ncbi:hypothetical protein UA08_09039 [Talaromyces atroroseus]|uniref:Acylphosphatase n=1 Tax=Talaromyces atroroseus TaxID=1441469 RepID=A0A1Q5Q7D8_TALAT|nr:hypothetical protein UA08_09039 [Talaromyces atroroseus]OKL55764.1 hypothetical protein UA08_09039 [Talaromyces atroroseus]
MRSVGSTLKRAPNKWLGLGVLALAVVGVGEMPVAAWPSRLQNLKESLSRRRHGVEAVKVNLTEQYGKTPENPTTETTRRAYLIEVIIISVPSYYNYQELARHIDSNGIDKVHGTVQGVSFRAFTQKKATEYGVTGWVQNSPDGRVEGEIQGEDSLVQKLLQDVNKGPRHAHVVKLEKSEIDTSEGESAFTVRK